MITFNEWHLIPNAIDKKTCKKIIALGKNSFEPGSLNIHKDTREDVKAVFKPGIDKRTRQSDIFWIKNLGWITDLIIPSLASANEKAGWKYNIIGVEALQLTRYRKGGFYSWHVDGKGCHQSARTYGEDPTPYVRKLSLTVLLNDNYEGGDFEFCSYHRTQHQITRPKMSGAGTMVVFPSAQEHRVVPVTKGTRYSLVGWFLGLPFV